MELLHYFSAIDVDIYYNWQCLLKRFTFLYKIWIDIVVVVVMESTMYLNAGRSKYSCHLEMKYEWKKKKKEKCAQKKKKPRQKQK